MILENPNMKMEPDGIRRGSFIVKYPVKYKKRKQRTKYDAFPIAKITFNTKGESSDSQLEISYDESSEISWVINVNITGEQEFGLIKASLSVDVGTTSTTTNCVGAKITKKVRKNTEGYCEIFAHGIYTAGTMVYKWADVAGNEGYSDKEIDATLPLRDYSRYNVHFGNLVYTDEY